MIVPEPLPVLMVLQCQAKVGRYVWPATGRPLPQTSGAPGQQAGPVGTNARASIARTFRANVRGRA